MKMRMEVSERLVKLPARTVNISLLTPSNPKEPLRQTKKKKLKKMDCIDRCSR